MTKSTTTERAIMNKTGKCIAVAVFLMLGTASNVLANHGPRMAKVEVTNLTANVIFTPPIIAASKKHIPFFQLGAAPSLALADLAEGGATNGLVTEFEDYDAIITQDGAPLLPGETRVYYIPAKRWDFVSFASMLLPTNDAFAAFSIRTKDLLNGVGIKAYDAGSEENSEKCADIPGPQCGGTPFSPGLAEGRILPHPGIHGEGDLSVNTYDWRDPVLWVKASFMHEDNE